MIDLLADHPHYLAHVDPVWNALPADIRGAVIERRTMKQPQSHAVLLASGADVRRARDLGYTRIALLEHGIGQSYLNQRSPSYPGAPGRGSVGLFLSPNATASARDRATYPDARHAIVGDPVIDTIPRREGEPNGTVAISFHWGWDGIPEMRSAFPHYREILPALVEAFPGRVIGHAHPRVAGAMERHYRKAGIPFVADWREVCRRADVYACDSSSTLYEFASTGRPVVVLNQPAYRREVDHGLRYWEAADVGIQVDDPQALVAAIDEALVDPPERQENREEALQLVYQPRTGAAARAAGEILDWLT